MAPFELSIVIEVFGLDRSELEVERWYTLDVDAVDPGEQPAVGGISILVPHGLSRMASADTVTIPGWPVHREVAPELISAVRRAHAREARIVSICSGAFVLAASGILLGRRAATRWQYGELLATKYPDVIVDREALYIDGGDVLTSAGSAAGIDLCLYLIRRDHGAAVANHGARRLVVPTHREGNQAQSVERPVAIGGGHAGPRCDRLDVSSYRSPHDCREARCPRAHVGTALRQSVPRGDGAEPHRMAYRAAHRRKPSLARAGRSIDRTGGHLRSASRTS
jgi:AraC family transcriptional activator FtrA